MNVKSLRFLVYGSGVIGSIFAGKLINTGFDVTMLARNHRVEELKENGLILQCALTGKRELYHPKIIKKLDPEDIYDYILVVMQKTQVEAVLPALAENRSPNIVFVVNNPSGYESWIQAIGRERVLIGFPAGGGERKEGVVHYFLGAGTSRLFQTTTFGEVFGITTQRLKMLIGAFKKAGIPSVKSGNMDAWQKNHIAVVFPIANALYKHNGDNYALAKSAEDIKLMIQATREGFTALKQIGFPVTPEKLNFYWLPCFLLVPVYKALMGSKIAEIAMARHANKAKDEMKLLQDEFLKLIAKANIPTPAINQLIQYNQDIVDAIHL
jgi:2-dehydropantoate 2-reductase